MLPNQNHPLSGVPPPTTPVLTPSGGVAPPSSPYVVPSGSGRTEVSVVIQPRQSALTIEGVVSAVGTALSRYPGSGSPADEDALFAAHTELIARTLEAGDLRPVIALWETNLRQLVINREGELKALIHKGAPLYNTGLAYFVAGDFDTSMAYLAEAGRADEKLGRGGRFPVLIGDHPLSKQFLIHPLVAHLFPLWASEYKAITNCVLDEVEFVSLIKQVASRPTDGIQLLAALHRLLNSRVCPLNDWAQYLGTRALADSLVALESMLRRINKGVESELYGQMVTLLKANTSAKRQFDSFNTWFDTHWVKTFKNKTAAAVNACAAEACKRMAIATTPAAKAGVACYVAVRLRNSLLHVLEDQLDIFKDTSKCINMIGYTLAVFRTVKHGEDGTLAGLP